MRGEIERDNRGGGRRMKERKMGNNNPTVVFNRGREGRREEGGLFCIHGCGKILY